MRERHFGPIATPVDGSESVDCDVGSLVRRLILFEECTIESILLREVPALVEVFGYDGLRSLLESPDVHVICDVMTPAQTGQFAFEDGVSAHHAANPDSLFRFASVAAAELKDYRHEALQIVDRTPGLTFKQMKWLRRELGTRALDYPREAGQSAVNQTKHDLTTDSASIRTAISWNLKSIHGIDVGLSCRIDVEEVGDQGSFRIDSNVSEVTGLSSEAAHKVVESSVLGVAGLNQRLELMKSFGALTGFQDSEVPLFEEKMDFFVRELDPGDQEARFDRVVRLAGLPSLDGLEPGVTIDVERLLALRNDRECRDFREFLRNVSGESDEEIQERFVSIHEDLAAITHTRTARATRFVVTNGVSLVPGAGLVLGPAAAAADKLIFDGLIGSPGPVSFIGRKYPSIFR